ncbi:MAG: peptidoglycan-binding protein [Acidimicrobiia bacterium]
MRNRGRKRCLLLGGVAAMLVVTWLHPGPAGGATTTRLATDPAAPNSVTAYGAATDFGSPAGQPLAAAIVGIAATPDGGGYWLVAADGGVFAYGTAAFHGSLGNLHLNQPIVGIAATPDGGGYWLVAADGGVFAHGTAIYRGAPTEEGAPDTPVVGMAASPDGDGYWLAERGGLVHAFGVDDLGSAAEPPAFAVRGTTVAVASRADGYWLAHGGVVESRVEDEGPAVEALQRRLTELGYWLGPVDGVFGTLTEQALIAFQKHEGLPPDGVARAGTQVALTTAGRPRPASTSGDLIEVDKTRQLVMVVRDGRALWVFNTSTGTEQPYVFKGETYLADTPPGVWTISSAIDGVRVGNLGRLYRPRYFHPDGIALHGYASVPAHPASHGCVRVTNAAIDFIWDEDLAPIGSEVWVYGTSPRT